MTIRKAKPTEIESIRDFLESHNLPVEGVREILDSFFVMTENDNLTGTVGLEVYGNKALLRSLAVSAESRGKGLGGRLYDFVIERAVQLGISEIYILTETAEQFFARRGFERIPRGEAAEAVKTSVEFRVCCPLSAVCMRMRLK